MLGWRFYLGLGLLMGIGCGTSAPPLDKPALPGSPPSTPSTAARQTGSNSGDSVPGDSKPASEQTVPEQSEPEPPFQLEEGFTPMSFVDFEAFGAETGTWEATAEGLKCTGKPRGYLYSKQSWQNFTLRLDYKFPRPASLKDDTKFKGNTGFLVYITGEHKLWPVCLEVQGKFVQMGAIKENGGAQPVTATDDDEARQKARKPVGQWNSLEIISVNGALAVRLNGVSVSQCEPNFLSEGLIGIQAEDHPFEVRRLRIRND